MIMLDTFLGWVNLLSTLFSFFLSTCNVKRSLVPHSLGDANFYNFCENRTLNRRERVSCKISL